ncbi:MAG: HlyD family efflux transporter periplasmic adaptor subunit [Candidatus Magasanikbacteria bacterium]|nr:HlyD family efflux transporter periplasmic adaptor subunit [Candidatus Magasanikbacteria bacterium]
MGKTSFYLIFTVVIGVALVSFWSYQKYFNKVEPEPLLFKVERGPIKEIVKVRGEVVSQKNFDLGFLFSGFVEKIFVKDGQQVNQNDPLLMLETTDFELEIRELVALLALSNANVKSQQAKLDELKKGIRVEEIQIVETKLVNSEKSLQDAADNLEKIKEKAQADLDDAYSNALTAIQKAVIVGKNALLTLTDIQYAHLLGTDQDAIAVAEKKAIAVKALLGADSAGRMFSNSLSILSGGAYSTVQKAAVNPVYVNIDSASLETLDALQKVKSALESVPVTFEWTSTEKINMSAEKNNVSAEISTISNRQKTIITQKSANASSISSAEAGVTGAKNTLATATDELILKRAGSTKEQITAQEAIVESGQANVQSVQARIAGVWEKIKKSTLYAPADAKITKVWFEKQELARPGQTAVTLETSGHKIQADVSELEIGKIREINGNKVLIQFDSFPDLNFNGEIISVEPKEIVKEGDKYYRVNVFIEPHDLEIRSGMSADLTILILSKDNILKIPELTIYKKDGKKFVTIFEESRQKEVEIKTGISNGESIEIISGLNEGQIVALFAD